MIKIKITGIGNSKNLIFNIFLSEGIPAELIDYNQEVINNHKSGPVIIAYDGFCVQEFLDFVPSLKKIKYIPIFFTTTNIYIFGMNSNDDNAMFEVCPVCIIKQVVNQKLNSKLYISLVKEIGFKSIQATYGKDLYHFSLLLLKMIKTNSLYNNFFNYSIYSNDYQLKKVMGLSRCINCDRTQYNSEELIKTLRSIL